VEKDGDEFVYRDCDIALPKDPMEERNRGLDLIDSFACGSWNEYLSFVESPHHFV